MAFFDDFKGKVKDFAAVAGEKARDLSDNAKTTASIMSAQRDIEKSYKVIGEWFVNEYEGEIPQSILDVVASIKASQERIAELRASREKNAVEEEPMVDVGKACPQCGEISNGRFCPKCGTSMAADSVVETVEEAVEFVEEAAEAVEETAEKPAE